LTELARQEVIRMQAFKIRVEFTDLGYVESQDTSPNLTHIQGMVSRELADMKGWWHKPSPTHAVFFPIHMISAVKVVADAE